MPSTFVMTIGGNTSYTDGSSAPIESTYDHRVGVYDTFGTVNSEVSARISQQSDFSTIVETFIVAALDPIFPTATVGAATPAEEKTLSALNLHLHGIYTPDGGTEHDISYTYEFCYGQIVEHLWGDSQDFVDAVAMDSTLTTIVTDLVNSSLNVT